MRAVIRAALGSILTLAMIFVSRAAAPVQAAPTLQTDTLVLTPTTQGTFTLPQTGVTLEIAYASVNVPSRLLVTRRDSPDGARYTFELGASGTAAGRFEMPLIAHLPPGAGPFPMTARAADGAALPVIPAPDASRPVTALFGWPLALDVVSDETPPSAPDVGRWLVVFDAHGLYAQPAWAASPGSIVYLGPLEHYTPDLIEHDLDWGTLRYTQSPPVERSIYRIETSSDQSALPTAARAPRYADRFVPEDKGNPGGFLLLGWAGADRLPDIVRALRATLPADPDLPAPGVPRAPLDLLLPFDCAQDWIISWGYHHSTPQNRFAVDFAGEGPGGAGGQPVYAAHAGTVYLKRYGPPDHLIDIGLAARVVAADGFTSTVYGHLDPAGTLARWGVDEAKLPDFAWVRVGVVEQGERIGAAGRTGYATGPHIHFVLWSWDQSLYQPVPLGPLTHFERGLRIPADRRSDCVVYQP